MNIPPHDQKGAQPNSGVTSLTVFWHAFLTGTALFALVSDVFLFLTNHHPAYRILTVVSALCMVASEIYHFVNRRDFTRSLRLRVFIDNSLFALALVLFREYAYLMVGTYFVMSSLQIFVLFYWLDGHKPALWYIRSVSLAVTAFCLAQQADFFSRWVLATILLSLVCVSFAVELARDRERRRQKEELRTRELEMQLLRHNVNNLTTTLLYNMDKFENGNITEGTLHATAFAMKGIGEVIKAFCSEDSSFALTTVSNNIRLFCSRLYPQVNLKAEIDGGAIVTTNLSCLLNALLVVVSNACEAGAKTVRLCFAENKLQVIDDGSGFDAKKIRYGYTTKTQGHGHGLAQAIESCALNSTPLTLQSLMGTGTTVTFDLSKVSGPAASRQN